MSFNDQIFYDIRNNILYDIENHNLYNNIYNSFSLKDLFRYFNLIENVKEYIINYIKLDSLNQLVGKKKSYQELAQILNMEYWYKEKEEFTIVDFRKKFKEKINSHLLIKDLIKIESLEDLSTYFNIENEMFAEYIIKIKQTILNQVTNEYFYKFVYEIVNYEELCQIFNPIKWFELRCAGQEIFSEEEEEFEENVQPDYYLTAQFEIDGVGDPKLVIYETTTTTTTINNKRKITDDDTKNKKTKNKL